MEEIFGTVEITAEKNLSNSDYVTGTYRLSRSYVTGISKIMRLVSLHYFTISQNEDGSTNIGLLGQTMGFEQVNPGIFLMSSGNHKQLWYADYNIDDKAPAINYDTFDILRISSFEFVADLLSFILLIAAVIYSIVYLIIALIRLIRKRKSPLSVWRLILCSSILLAIVNLIIYISNIAAYASTPISIMINGIVYILLGIVPIAYAVILAKNWKPLKLSKKQKMSLVVHGIMGMIVTFNILYWQLWMFWV
jgi:hypothetical protein